MDTVRPASRIRIHRLCLPIAILLGVTAMDGYAANRIDFDAMKAGAAPAGWTCGMTGKGSPRWTIEADASAPSAPNVLRQSGSATFPWCVHAGSALADGFVEVRFKAISGREDQAGGVVWRWKD